MCTGWITESQLQYGKKCVKILDQCAHCFLSQGATDGPCKVSAMYPDWCINQAETVFCSTSQSEFNICKAREPGIVYSRY